MTNIITPILAIALTAAAGFALIQLMLYGIDKTERAACYKLQEYTELRGFYITHSEKQQCEAAGVTINAPVL